MSRRVVEDDSDDDDGIEAMQTDADANQPRRRRVAVNDDDDDSHNDYSPDDEGNSKATVSSIDHFAIETLRATEREHADVHSSEEEKVRVHQSMSLTVEMTVSSAAQASKRTNWRQFVAVDGSSADERGVRLVSLTNVPGAPQPGVR